jgi:hypothetical protein
VQPWAETWGIEWLYLPPSAPHLHLRERLWKVVKKQCRSSPSYPDRAASQRALQDCLDPVPTTHKAALDSLLTWRFQTFPAVPVVGDPPELGLAPAAKRAEPEGLSMAA